MIRSRLRTTVAAVMLLALVLAGCSSDVAGGQADGGTEGGGEAAEGADGAGLTIAASTNETPALDAAIASFEESNPDADIQVTYAGVDQYQTTLRTQLSSGTAPDIFFVWPGDGNPLAMQVVAEAGFLADLSDRDWADQIPEGIRPVTEMDGTTWIAPIGFSGIGAIYNTTALDEVGLEAPTTWTELLAFCDAAQQEGRVAFALGNQTSWVTQLVNYALAPTLVYGPNPDFAEEMAAGEATFVGSEWETTMDKYLEMNESGCFNDQPLGTSYEASLEMTANGDALGIVQVNSGIAAMERQAPEGTEFEMLPLPATDDPEETRMAGAAGSSYGLNVNSADDELANEFLDYLMSPEGMNQYANTLSALPAIPNESFEVPPALETLSQFQEEGRTDPYMDQLWPNARVQQTHFQVIQSLFSGSMTVEEALAQMDEAYAQGE